MADTRPQRNCRQPHGTVARHVSGCSCLMCCDAHRDYIAEYKLDPNRTVDAAPVREHIRTLVYNGWRTRGIAEQAGVSYNTVRYCRTGRRVRIHRDSAAAILSLPLQTPIPTDSTALVPARSTLRLIERLNKTHSLDAIAHACGVTRNGLPQPGQRSVQARTARCIKQAAIRLDQAKVSR